MSRVRMILAGVFTLAVMAGIFLPEKIAGPIVDIVSNPLRLFWNIAKYTLGVYVLFFVISLL